MILIEKIDSLTIIFLALLSNVTYIEQFNREFDKLAPIVFLYEQNTDNSKIVSKGLKTTYFNDKPIDKTQITKLAQVKNAKILKK